MTRIPRHHHDTYPGRDTHRARLQRAAHELLAGLGVRPAPACDERDLGLVRSLDALLAQTVRAARHTSGTVRAYASLIQDGYDSTSNAAGWAARISHAAGELDDYAARVAALRACETERVCDVNWAELLARVAARCGSCGACTIEVVERTPASFRQRGEWIARALFHALRNAVEATPRGGIVRVRADQIRVESAQAVHVRITDAGRGIAPDMAPEAIWKPFITNKANHAGLGLAYVASCADRLGMINGIRSDTSGTTFHGIIFAEGELTW